MTVKTVLATGASSGIGFEVVKQLLAQTQQPYRFILGCRDPAAAQSAFDALSYDTQTHAVDVLPLELNNLKTVKSFASEAWQQLEENGQSTPLDYLLMNAGLAKAAKEPSPTGSKWCEAYVVNHLSQHYLVHLLRSKLMVSKSRLVYVSSGAVRGDRDTNALPSLLKDQSGADEFQVYASSKFTQLLGALYWKRQLSPPCTVIAVSPGLIPSTGIGRYSNLKISPDMPDAKSVPEGAAAVIEAFHRSDFPKDNANAIALASWGDWWEPETYEAAFDEKLQDQWAPSQEQIEKEERVQ